MKTDRNYGGTPYPVYPNTYNTMPMGPMPLPANMPDFSGNDINVLNQKINSLEQRITNLENTVFKNDNYNTSNFQMM